MKVLNLNIWGGQRHKELLDYLHSENNNIDIFCFQEVFKSDTDVFSSGSKMNIYQDIEKILKDYHIVYSPTFKNYDLKKAVDFEVLFGQAIFVKNSLELEKEGAHFIYKTFNETHVLHHDEHGDYWDLPRNLNYIVFKCNNKHFLIANAHGFWKPSWKEDSKESLEQSDKIIKFLDRYNCSKILCGDFNLGPQTESIKKIEKKLTNLITGNKIENTRSKFYTRSEKFADYIFTTPDVKVIDFKALDIHVSDHLPLYLEFG